MITNRLTQNKSVTDETNELTDWTDAMIVPFIYLDIVCEAYQYNFKC